MKIMIRGCTKKIESSRRLDSDLREIINNAKRAAKRDGYYQDIILDATGYAFIRHYPNNLRNNEQMIGQVQIHWNDGIPNITYTDNPNEWRLD